MQARFRELVETELQVRRAKNSRYSIRAFAAFLGTDHSTLSQILRGTRRAPAASIRKWCRKLGLADEEAAVLIAAEHIPGSAAFHREEQLRHWTAEAMGIVTGPAHSGILRLASMPGFRPDTRWIA